MQANVMSLATGKRRGEQPWQANVIGVAARTTSALAVPSSATMSAIAARGKDIFPRPAFPLLRAQQLLPNQHSLVNNSSYS